MNELENATGQAVNVDPLVSEISINEAAAKGITRLRKKVWATREDHLKIDIIDGKPGPWTHLFSPFNKECNGRDPVDILATNMDYNAKEFIPYSGPLPESDEYTILYRGIRLSRPFTFGRY